MKRKKEQPMSKLPPDREQRILDQYHSVLPRLIRVRNEVDRLIKEMAGTDSVIDTRSPEERVAAAAMQAVCRVFEMTPEQVVAKTRKPEFTYPRFVFSALCRNHTRFGFAKIGSYINKDHAGAKHGCTQVENARETHGELWELYELAETELEKEKALIYEAQKTEPKQSESDPPE